MSKLKYVKIRDIMAVFQFLIVLPIALLAKIFIHDFWLVSEEKFEARDNGYWFFKYVRKNYPKQKIAYAIDKNSVDYNKVSNIGKVISYGTWAHWFWYLVAKKNISSQKGGKPNAAVCYLFEVAFPILRTKRYFLQHGITINDSKWLYYKETRFTMFICGAKPEYEFVKEKFGYPDGIVKYLGFSRFDELHDPNIDKNLILVMPTWRNWLSRDLKNDLLFKETDYCVKWNEFINSEKLNCILEKNNKKLLFYPHRNMQKFLGEFKTNFSTVEIIDSKTMDIQEVLKKCGLMITDYSSVFFDFAYMKKPVIFYQFDEAEFRLKQYQEGYFNYHDNLLGKWTDNLDGMLKILESEIENGIKENDNIKTFFQLYDNKNSERIFNEIVKNN